MKIAVEGCAHGELDNIYASLKYLEEIENIKIDLLICCGDFQAIRNENDLESLNCPLKYRTMGSFWRYYSGEVLAPIPTIFVGGNHEASNYLWELYYGGFAAPRIFFMGFAGVIRFGNVRIGGLSGIFKQYSYRSGHHEKLPYDKNDIKSVYHVREYDVQKLLQIKEPLDIFISHDWPRGVTDYGNVKQLVRHKPYFETEIKEGNLGSKPGELLLKQLKPSYWFAGHLHTKFAAIVQHDKQGPVTKFLALDKCLPGRNFLQVIEVESGEGPHDFYYDEEWLSITRTYNSYLPLRKHFQSQRPAEQDLAVNRDWVKKRLADLGNKPLDFKMTVPPHNPLQRMSSSLRLQGHVRNPQTEAFLKLLDLPYLLDSSVECTTPNKGSVASEEIANDPNEIALDDEDAILSDEEIEDLSYSEITN